MNLAELQKRLLSAARADRPGDHVPYAFEKRVMAHLATKPAPDVFAVWNRTLWRAAAPCVAVMLLLGAWTFLAPRTDNSGTTLAAELESALYAPFDNQTEAW